MAPEQAESNPAFKVILKKGEAAVPALTAFAKDTQNDKNPRLNALKLLAEVGNPKDQVLTKFLANVRDGLVSDLVESYFKNAAGDALDKLKQRDNAMLHQIPQGVKTVSPFGGIDLSQLDPALHVAKDANGGVTVNVDPALIARVEREGLPELDPVIIGMRPADIKTLFGVSV